MRLVVVLVRLWEDHYNTCDYLYYNVSNCLGPKVGALTQSEIRDERYRTEVGIETFNIGLTRRELAISIPDIGVIFYRYPISDFWYLWILVLVRFHVKVTWIWPWTMNINLERNMNMKMNMNMNMNMNRNILHEHTVFRGQICFKRYQITPILG